MFFILTNSADANEMDPYETFHLGLHCLPEYQAPKLFSYSTQLSTKFILQVEYSRDSTLYNKSKCKLTPKEVAAKPSISFGVMTHLLSFYNLRPLLLPCNCLNISSCNCCSYSADQYNRA